MSLLRRKSRPVERNEEALRDDRLFLIACDDTFAPKQYFDFFKIPRIQVHVVPTEDGSSFASHVLDRLLAFAHEEDDERWLILDTDHCTQGTHLPNFLHALREAGQRGVRVALSMPSFELWLLLHHVDTAVVENLADATEVEALLRNTLGEYSKRRLKPEHFTLEGVLSACIRAEELDRAVGGGVIPAGNTSRVYQIWKSIADKGLSTQLPEALVQLKHLGDTPDVDN